MTTHTSPRRTAPISPLLLRLRPHVVRSREGVRRETDPSLTGPELADQLIRYCRERLIKWSCPRDVLFPTELPKTRVGKIDLAALVQGERVGGGATRNTSPPTATCVD
jgi:acyl-coenzyme A synthetase/AMP-(fatty) acid ligase